MDDDDQYVAQLREVFDTCDSSGNGQLNREQLAELCEKLQLEAQSQSLIAYLLNGDDDKEVDFETFKEGFITVLSTDADFSVADELPSDVEDDPSVSMSLHHELGEVSPKYIKNGRRYGRKSRPDIDHSVAYTEPVTDSEDQFPVKRSKNSMSESIDDPDRDLLDDADEFEHDPVSTTIDLQNLETFEGDGQLNASMGMGESPSSEEEQMRKIWNDVGVGRDGFLDIDELAVVCEHIGMEEMNKDELQNLFSKLDEDGDGRVGFDEFLQGLFKHEGATPSPRPPPALLSTPTHKPKLSRTLDDHYHRAATPSIYIGTQNIKLFTALDPENSGFAGVDNVLEFWQSQGLQNPLEILEALDTDMEAGKVNLQDLSLALEQVLISTEEDNDIFQAAVVSYQGEFKHVRAQLESLEDERDKLKADLTDAHQQSAAMLQEVDERHANIEKTHETKIKSMEKKYQDKITSLQNELAMDRETLTSHAISQRQSLEEELEALKVEESHYRNRVDVLEKENERLDTENEKAAEKLIESQKTISKQQRDLEGFQELEERLAGLETNTDTISKQQIQSYEDAIQDYQQLLRKEQDKVDELTQENELLKHQSSERKVRRRGGNKSQRRPNILDFNSKLRKQTESSTEYDSEFDENEILTEDRAGGDGNSITDEEMKKLDAEVAKWEARLELMQEEHDDQMERARANFESEFGDMEEKYKVRIIEMEDDFEKERNKLREEADDEKERLSNQLTELEKALEVEREDLKEKHEKEKQEIREKLESENLEVEQAKANFEAEFRDMEDKYKARIIKMEDDFEKEREELGEKADNEKEGLRTKLEGKFQKDLDNQLEKLRTELIKEKDREISALEKELAKEQKESEKRIKSLQEELEVKLKNDKEDMEGFYRKERDELELRLQEKTDELDSILQEGEIGLQGQLKEDFQELLEKHKEELEENYRREKELLMDNLEKEREELQEQYEQEKSEMNNSLGSEKEDMLKRMRQEKEELIERFKKDKNGMEEKFQQEKKRITEKHEREKDLLRKELEKDKKKLSQELQKDKDKTMKQLSKEKVELERQLQSEREKYKMERQVMEDKFALELEALRGSHQVERENMEKSLREKEIEEEFQRSAQQNYEDELEQLRQELEEEKTEFTAERRELQLQLKAAEVAREEAMTAITVHSQQSSPEKLEVKQSANDELSHKNSLLELNLSRLEEKLGEAGEKLEHSKNTAEAMETQISSLKSERNRLKADLDGANRKLMELQMKVTISESQHSRELQRVKATQQKELESEVRKLKDEIREKERRLKESQSIIKDKEEEMTRMMAGLQESEEVRALKRQKEEAERRYKKTRGLLNEYMKKLREQVAKSTRSDGLVKDLYKENSKLQKVLQLTEERQKRAERSSMNLIEKNHAYLGLLKKICPAAV